MPLMGATVLADMIARTLLTESIMTEKLARRAVTVPGEYRPDVMATTRVRSIMSTAVETFPADLSVGDAVERFVAGSHSGYPVLDDAGRCLGVVTRADLLTATTGSLGELVDGPPVVVAPGDPAIDVLSRMVEDGVDHVPVLDDTGRLVGICTRGDLLRARRDADRADQREPGWIGRLRVGGA